jgi:DNA-binding XRE family transcriptional regulator
MPRSTKLSKGTDAAIERVSLDDFATWAFSQMIARNRSAKKARGTGFSVDCSAEDVPSPDGSAAPADSFKAELKVRLGVTVMSAAEALGVSRQRIYQLVKDRQLEAFELTDDLGNSAGVFIRTDSLKNRIKSQGKPIPRRFTEELRDPAFPFIRNDGSASDSQGGEG